ncbi:MAG TPA: LamG domain-containing protein, partial [Candidatus Limnocylindria bacterium]|nr:LamG domain-containing protein [Candidatus Limnocylindria bacterium]
MQIKYFLLFLFLITGLLAVRQQVKAAELVGHWALDESSQGASVIDSGTGGNNGTPSGTGGGPSPTSTVPSVSFTDTGSYYFNGVDQHVQIASSFRSAVSVTFWFLPLANGSGGGNDQWYNGSGLFDAEIGGVTNDFGVTWSANHVEFGIGNPDVTIRSGALALGSWYHVADTWQKSDGAMKLYINGSLVDSSTGSSNDRISTNVRFGVELSGANAHYNGYMDDIRTFDVALDPSQVQTMANGNSITLTDADNSASARSLWNYLPPQPFTPSEGFFNLRLNEDATSTDSSLVKISSNAGSDVRNIKISKNPDMTNSIIVQYSKGMPWDLCWLDNPCPLGTHTIYAQLINGYGSMTQIVNDSIELVAKQQELAKNVSSATSTPETGTSTLPTILPNQYKLLKWEDLYNFQNNLQMSQTGANIFGKDLKLGDVGEDVRKLQKFLNAQNFILTYNPIGGARGKETRNFQRLTYNAL